jgi:hypothetical protein
MLRVEQWLFQCFPTLAWLQGQLGIGKINKKQGKADGELGGGGCSLIQAVRQPIPDHARFCVHCTDGMWLLHNLLPTKLSLQVPHISRQWGQAPSAVSCFLGPPACLTALLVGHPAAHV